MSKAAVKAKTESMLKALWQRQLPVVREHLQRLEASAMLVQEGRLTAPLRSESAVSAHKLAGSLGMFGYPEGTRLARDIEYLLDAEGEPPLDTYLSLVRQLRDLLS